MKRSLVMQKRDKPAGIHVTFGETSLLGDLRMLEDSAECPACGEEKPVGRLLCGRHMQSPRKSDEENARLVPRWVYAHLSIFKSSPRAYDIFEECSRTLGFDHRRAIDRLRLTPARIVADMKPRLVKARKEF